MKTKHEPVLVIRLGGGVSYQFFLLNPGDLFPGFGGTSQGLQVKKTASLIVRHNTGNCVQDTEYDLCGTERSDAMWQWVQEFINKGTPHIIAEAAASQRQQCLVTTHPGTSKHGFRCVLNMGHEGDHDFGTDYRSHKEAHGHGESHGRA